MHHYLLSLHSLTVPGTVQVVNAVPKLFTKDAASVAAATTSLREAPLAAAAPATCCVFVRLVSWVGRRVACERVCICVNVIKQSTRQDAAVTAATPLAHLSPVIFFQSKPCAHYLGRSNLVHEHRACHPAAASDPFSFRQRTIVGHHHHFHFESLCLRHQGSLNHRGDWILSLK